MCFYYSVWSLINKACIFFFIIVLSAELWYKLHTDSVSLAYLVLLHPGGEHPPSWLLAHEGWNIALATRRSPHVDGTMACVGLAVLGLACGDILPSFLLPELSLFPSFYGERREAAVYAPPGDVQSHHKGSGLRYVHCRVPDLHRGLKRLPPRFPLLFNNIKLHSLHFLHCEGTSWGYSSWL